MDEDQICKKKKKKNWSMPIKSHYSYVWKNILNCREIGAKLIERKFKDGKCTSLWFDPWINGNSLINLLGWNNLYYFGKVNASVDNIIQYSTWNTQAFPATTIFNSSINKIEIDPNTDEDAWCWKLSLKGKFLLKILGTF